MLRTISKASETNQFFDASGAKNAMEFQFNIQRQLPTRNQHLPLKATTGSEIQSRSLR
jgi:hypothetical protein